MERIENAYERLLFGVANRATERGIALLAAILYGGIGLALPLAAGWPVPWLVAANVIGTTLAGTFLLVWLAVRVEASRRRNLLEWTTDLRRLDAAEFEWLVGEVYRREGWRVEEVGRQGGPDGGIDLLLQNGRERVLVQCKRWTSWQVGVDDIRAFAGVLARESLPTKAGSFVTMSNFTEEAQSDGRRLGMTLIDGAELYAKVERVRRSEPCPKCHHPMLLDRSPRGWWFRCLDRACGGKRDISNEPGEAVQVLTQPPGSTPS